jgi:hypothetical protein
MSNILTAHREWASRPPDQRYQTFDALEAAVLSRRTGAYETTTPTRTLRVIPTDGGDLGLEINAGFRTNLSNWSFGQLCKITESPGDFVRDLPADLAATVLNRRLLDLKECADRVQTLTHGDGTCTPTLRAITSEIYTRIWDADVVQMVRRMIRGTAFSNPLAFKDGRFGGEVEPGGLYASDRDVFVLVWDQEHPIEIGSEQLFRFAMFWNSEVGARTFGATLGLVRTICRNLIIWDARELTNVSIRHVGRADDRLANEIPRMLDALAVRDPYREKQVISAAIAKSIAKSDDEAVTWLRGRGLPLKVARASIGKANEEENGAGTLWQVVQGVTAYARTIPYRDQRVALERTAGRLLEAGI